MEVCPRIHALKIPFQIKPKPGMTIKRFVYVYFLLGERTFLVDAGVAGCEGQIFDYLRSCGRDPSDIAAVILTHAHPDHIGSLYTLKESLGCDVWAHAGAQDWVENIDIQAQARPVPGFHDLVSGSVKVDRLLADGECLELAGIGPVHVLHTPGHCPGSTSFWLPRQGGLITGDALCVGAGFPVYDDVVASLASIERLAEIPDVKHLLGSWDIPRQAHEVSGVIDEARRLLARVDTLVREALNHGIQPEELMPMTEFVIHKLGLPEIVVNRLTARAIGSHVENLSNPMFTRRLGRSA